MDDKYPTVNDLVTAVEATKADSFVCDHKLTEGSYAGFMGIEAVAAMYERKLPALLVTDYAETDLRQSIWKYRKKVPVLIPGRDFQPKAIASGFANWEQEVLQHDIPVARRPRRAFVHVVDIEDGQKGRLLTVYVPRWQEHRAIQIPATLLPAEMAYRLAKGQKVIASINTEAERPEDLYFEDFEELPDDGDQKA